MKSQLTVGIAALGFFRSRCLLCVLGVCSREKAFVFVRGARAVMEQKSPISNCTGQRPQCSASVNLQGFLLCFKMTWGISTGRQRLRNEEGSLAAGRDPGRALPQKPGRSPSCCGVCHCPQDSGALPSRRFLGVLSPGLCVRLLAAFKPRRLRVSWFPVGLGKCHAQLGDGGRGTFRPHSFPVGPGRWLHRGFSSCAGSLFGSRVHPPPWLVQGEH